MATNVQLPEIGEGVNEGELVSWLVQPGDSVEVDQPIAELMTDKATVEVPSPIAGTVKELKFSDGDTIEVGNTMITVEEGASSSPKKRQLQWRSQLQRLPRQRQQRQLPRFKLLQRQ